MDAESQAQRRINRAKDIRLQHRTHMRLLGKHIKMTEPELGLPSPVSEGVVD